MRLEPVEFGRRDRADVQAVDVRRVGQLALPLLVVRDRRRDERRADLLYHQLLRILNDCDVREHVLGVGDLRVGQLAMIGTFASATRRLSVAAPPDVNEFPTLSSPSPKSSQLRCLFHHRHRINDNNLVGSGDEYILIMQVIDLDAE